MLYTDVIYASRLGAYLRNFKRKNNYLFNASCPICGDSKKDKRKARLYIYQHKDALMVKCHKCGFGSSLGNFIKELDYILYTEYRLETLKDDPNYKPKVRPPADISSDAFASSKQIVLPKKEQEIVDSVLDDLTPINMLPPNHPAVTFVRNRKIPEDMESLFYYTDTFYQYVNTNIEPDKYTNINNDHPRLIIPFINEFGKVFALQGRSLDGREPRYFTIKINKDDEKIFGMDRVDYSKRVYITEGPIDSLFLPNALAVSGSSFDSPTVKRILTNATIISDNEPRHKNIVAIMEKNIAKGYSIVIWPERIREKDING